MNNLITELKAFIDREYDEENRQIEEIWAKPLNERVLLGEAIDNIYIKTHRMSILNISIIFSIDLHCQENISKFRKGSKVILHQNTLNKGYSCEIVQDKGNELVVSAGFPNNNFVFPSEIQDGPGWVLDNDKVDIRHIIKSALDQLLTSPSLKNYIHGIITGQSRITLNEFKKNNAEHLSQKYSFNPNQKKAFVNSLSTNNFNLIQGPPGTGKTWLLAHIAHELALSGENVLITAFTHRAINNALVKIAKVTSYEHIIKIGQSSNADDLTWDNGKVENYEKIDRSPYNSNSKGVILGATCYSVVPSRLSGFQFDTVIFDEAGQLTIPLGIVGMLAGNRYIFIGDHQQMPPIIKAKHSNENLTKSIFELLFSHNPGVMLNITYRMNKVINNFPSNKFYDGNLISDPTVANGKIKYNSCPVRYAQILDAEASDVFVDLKHRNRGIRSPEEAEIIVELLKELISLGVPATEIAVIAPYRAQGRLIRKNIQDKFGEDSEKILESIVVDTVERIQGQERDVVLISLTTSDPVHAAQRAEFYFKPNRLNVAITRPRFKRILVGSSHLFAANPKDEGLELWINNFRELYNEAQKIEMI